MQFDKEFDACGLSCPLPIVKTKKSPADMASGQEGGKYVFMIRKA